MKANQIYVCFNAGRPGGMPLYRWFSYKAAKNNNIRILSPYESFCYDKMVPKHIDNINVTIDVSDTSSTTLNDCRRLLNEELKAIRDSLQIPIYVHEKHDILNEISPNQLLYIAKIDHKKISDEYLNYTLHRCDNG